MEKDDRVYLGHMLDMARLAFSKIEHLSREDFDDDENLRLACVHLIQLIGEAARRVSPASRDEMPFIPWREIVGTRHRIIHDYMNVDEDVVWEVLSRDLVPLIAALERAMSKP